MHRTDHSRFRKAHDFVPDFSHAERRTRIVIGVTAAMMIVEIAVGLMSHSMALLAHEHACPGIFDYRRGVLLRKNASWQRALQLRYGKDWCAGRVHQRSRALDRCVIDGWRIRAPVVCPAGNSF